MNRQTRPDHVDRVDSKRAPHGAKSKRATLARKQQRAAKQHARSGR